MPETESQTKTLVTPDADDYAAWSHILATVEALRDIPADDVRRIAQQPPGAARLRLLAAVAAARGQMLDLASMA